MGTSLQSKQEFHVICLDDDQAFLNSLEMSLSDKLVNDDCYHYNLLFIDNPIKTLELIDDLLSDKEEIALVMADQMMPNMKGIDFLREANNKIPDSMKVLLTGYAGMGSAILAINEKILDKYLTKPIEDIDDLVVTLKHLLNEFQLKRSVELKQQLIGELYGFSNSLNSQTSLSQTMKQIISFTQHILHCNRISILLIEKEELVIKAAQGIPQNLMNHIHIPIGKRVAGKVFGQHEAVIVKDIRQIPWLGVKINPEFKSFISLPLVYAGLGSASKPLGVINVTNKIGNLPFDERDLKVLWFIANTASIAINNQINLHQLEKTYFDIVKSLIIALEARDIYTKGHSHRVMEYSAAIARNLGFSRERIDLMEKAAILHDIGKIGISDSLLLKPDRLTPEEYAQIQEHPTISGTIIAPISFLKEAVSIVQHHHEKLDGTGYPDGLKGKEIPLEARIMAVADSYDAMTSDRPYRKRLSPDVAMAELKKCAGSQFDSQCVEAFLRYLKRDENAQGRPYPI